MCTDEKLSDKTLYPTFSRTIPPISGLVPPLHALMKHFNWSRVGFIAQTTQRWSQWNALEKGLRDGGLVVGIVRTMTFGVHYNATSLVPEFEGLLQSTAKESRGRFHHLLSKINSLFLQTQAHRNKNKAQIAEKIFAMKRHLKIKTNKNKVLTSFHAFHLRHFRGSRLDYPRIARVASAE